jgi:hypothetical protein
MNAAVIDLFAPARKTGDGDDLSDCMLGIATQRCSWEEFAIFVFIERGTFDIKEPDPSRHAKASLLRSRSGRKMSRIWRRCSSGQVPNPGIAVA